MALVNQKALAADLGLSDRRVRQMVEQHLLPPACNGRFDVARARVWFSLYKQGRYADWSDFESEVETLAHRAERLVDAALAPSAKLDDISTASRAVQASMAAMRFLTACRSKTDAERVFVMMTWQRLEDDGLRLLIGRARELLAGKNVAPQSAASRGRKTTRASC